MYNPDGTRYTMMNGGGWMIGFAVLTMVLLCIAVVAVLVNLYLHASRRPHPIGPTSGPGQEARTLLDGRLARGEVTPEEYRAIRGVLDGG